MKFPLMFRSTHEIICHNKDGLIKALDNEIDLTRAKLCRLQRKIRITTASKRTQPKRKK